MPHLSVRSSVACKKEGNILQGEKITIGEVDVPILLVADSAYPLSTWLMKPFPHGSTLTQGQKKFNYNLSCARIVIEMPMVEGGEGCVKVTIWSLSTFPPL